MGLLKTSTHGRSRVSQHSFPDIIVEVVGVFDDYPVVQPSPQPTREKFEDGIVFESLNPETGVCIRVQVVGRV